MQTTKPCNGRGCVAQFLLCTGQLQYSTRGFLDVVDFLHRTGSYGTSGFRDATWPRPCSAMQIIVGAAGTIGLIRSMISRTRRERLRICVVRACVVHCRLWQLRTCPMLNMQTTVARTAWHVQCPMWRRGWMPVFLMSAASRHANYSMWRSRDSGLFVRFFLGRPPLAATCHVIFSTS